MAKSPLYVVMTGLPASGKTTVAQSLGRVLGLTIYDKDTVLERTFRQGAVYTPAERARLSRQADESLREMVAESEGGILVSFWRRPDLSATSGTPTEWIQNLPYPVEVYCACSPATAVGRFMARKRHPAHGDAGKEPSHLLEQFTALHDLGPLGVGRLVEISTEAAVNVAELAARVSP